MNTTKRFDDLEVTIPAIETRTGTEKQVDVLRTESNKKLQIEFAKIEQELADKIEKSVLEKFKAEFFQKEKNRFIITETIHDKEKWNQLQKKWFALSKEYFELNLEMSQTGCDEYDMNYTMESEFYQFLHENPDKRRERLEAPIQRKIDKVEAETAEIEAEQNKITEYKLEGDSQTIYNEMEKMYNKLLSLN